MSEDESVNDTKKAKSLTEGGKEQIKLRASFINGIAIATFAVGGIAPFVRAISDVSPTAPSSVFILMLVCFAIAAALHLYAYWYLERLNR